jgi:regulator of protease activity HflC (stomatin/prohibitin superfamily)
VQFSLLAIVIIGIMIIFSAIRVLREYERGVVFRLGRLAGVRGPGIIFLVPIIDKMVKVSLRVVTMDVTPQDIITRDNVSVKVNAVVYFRVLHPDKAIIEVKTSYTPPGSSRKLRCVQPWASSNSTNCFRSATPSIRSSSTSSTSKPTRGVSRFRWWK